MDDGLLIDNEDLGSTHMRARDVRGEVLTGPERRRRWSVEEKLRILAQSVAPGSSVMLVCRMHGISSGQLYTWRRQFRTGELTGFAPVTLAPPVGQLAAPSAPVDPAPTLPRPPHLSDDGWEIRLMLYRQSNAISAVALSPYRAIALVGELV